MRLLYLLVSLQEKVIKLFDKALLSPSFTWETRKASLGNTAKTKS